jgi:hypothetical protein
MEIQIEEDRYYDKRNGERIYLSEIIQELLSLYENSFYNNFSKITDFSPGSEAYQILLKDGNLVMDSIIREDEDSRQMTFQTAENDALDSFGDEKGVYRNDGTFSTGTVTFIIPEIRTESVVIPAGTTLTTDDTILFYTDEDATISAGLTSVDVDVTCFEVGLMGNVKANTINMIDSELGFPCTVNNQNDFINGEDEENDDEYRERIKNDSSNYPSMSYAWMEHKAEEVVSKASYQLNSVGNLGTITYKPSDNPIQDYNNLITLFNDKRFKPAHINLEFVEGNGVIVIENNYEIIFYIDGSVPFNIIKELAISIVNDYVDDLDFNDTFSVNDLKHLLLNIEGTINVEMIGYSNIDLSINQYPIIDGALSINQGS